MALPIMLTKEGRLLLLLAMLIQSAQPEPAISPPQLPPLHGGPQEINCPVGGERFSAWRPSMYSTFGMRPDGKPYSYLPFPFPVPECPGNKLIVFDEFSAAETTALGKLIAANDYKVLIDAETTYYRAYWLAKKLERSRAEALGLLLSAIWQVSPNDGSSAGTEKSSVQFKQYQEEFVSEVRALSPAVPAKDRLWLGARAANAARQLKQFHEAEQLRKRAQQSLSGDPEDSGWITYLAKLQVVIARRDASIEPLDMIPPMQVAFACARQSSTSAFDRAACAEPAIAARVAELRKSR